MTRHKELIEKYDALVKETLDKNKYILEELLTEKSSMKIYEFFKIR